MRETPNARRGTASMLVPTMNAASAPDGERERFRRPCRARKLAITMGKTGRDVSAMMEKTPARDEKVVWHDKRAFLDKSDHRKERKHTETCLTW